VHSLRALDLHSEDVSCLDISDFYPPPWPGYFTSRISDDWQGICVDGLDFVLSIQLTFQDLPSSLYGDLVVIGFLVASL